MVESSSLGNNNVKSLYDMYDKRNGTYPHTTGKLTARKISRKSKKNPTKELSNTFSLDSDLVGESFIDEAEDDYVILAERNLPTSVRPISLLCSNLSSPLLLPPPSLLTVTTTETSSSFCTRISPFSIPSSPHLSSSHPFLSPSPISSSTPYEPFSSPPIMEKSVITDESVDLDCRLMIASELTEITELEPKHLILGIPRNNDNNDNDDNNANDVDNNGDNNGDNNKDDNNDTYDANNKDDNNCNNNVDADDVDVDDADDYGDDFDLDEDENENEDEDEMTEKADAHKQEEEKDGKDKDKDKADKAKEKEKNTTKNDEALHTCRESQIEITDVKSDIKTIINEKIIEGAHKGIDDELEKKKIDLKGVTDEIDNKEFSVGNKNKNDDDDGSDNEVSEENRFQNNMLGINQKLTDKIYSSARTIHQSSYTVQIVHTVSNKNSENENITIRIINILPESESESDKNILFERKISITEAVDMIESQKVSHLNIILCHRLVYHVISYQYYIILDYINIIPAVLAYHINMYLCILYTYTTELRSPPVCVNCSFPVTNYTVILTFVLLLFLLSLSSSFPLSFLSSFYLNFSSLIA